MSTSPTQSTETVAPKTSREVFEESVWSQYFIRTIGRSSSSKGFALVSRAEMDKAGLCKRDSNDDYVDENVGAMWFGWQAKEKCAVDEQDRALRAAMKQSNATDAPKAYMGQLTIVSASDGGMENTVRCLVVARSSGAAFDTLNEAARTWYSENDDEVSVAENDITGGDEPAYAYEASQGTRTSVAHREVQEVSAAAYQEMKHHLLVYTQEGCPEPVAIDASAGQVDTNLKDALACLQAMWQFASGLVEKHGMDGDDTLTDAEHAAWQAAGGQANWLTQQAEKASASAASSFKAPATSDQPEPAADTYVVSPAQRVLFSKFSEGDFAHFSDLTSKAALDKALDDCGDGLLRFMALELASAEGCETFSDAVDRMRSAEREMSVVYDALEAEETAEVYAPATPVLGDGQQRG